MKIRFLLLIFLILITVSCGTVKYRYNSQDDYKVFFSTDKPDVIFRIKENYKGKVWGEIYSDLLYKAWLIGEVKFFENGDIEFNVSSVKYFANWPNGWTEGESDAYGKLLFKNTPNGMTCEVKEPYELWDVSEGQIRYMDNYYIDDDGKQKVKQRMDRIVAVVDFLKKQDYPDYFNHVRFNSSNGSGFIKTTKPFLFPECVGDKPEIYYDTIKSETNNENEQDNKKENNFKWSIGEGKIWSKVYTKKIFPEQLQGIRNAGTMWRDYEEAPGIFMMVYNMDYFYNKHLTKVSFKKVK